MDLSPRQQKTVFVVVVVVLAALGYWLILPKITRSHGSAQAATPPTPSVAGSVPASQVAQGATPAPATAAPGATGLVNIYSWLPFTQRGLADAAAVTVKFGADYNTYSYTESASGYVGTMNSLITRQLATTLQSLYSTPGVAKVRTSQKQVSTGTAVIDSLRSFGPSSLTFVVTAGQHLVTSNGTTDGSAQYAVTVTGSGTSWQVNDIELSTAGQS